MSGAFAAALPEGGAMSERPAAESGMGQAERGTGDGTGAGTGRSDGACAQMRPADREDGGTGAGGGADAGVGNLFRAPG